MENIENMMYANKIGYSDVDPYEVIEVISDKTMVVREMKAEKAEWKMDFQQGGFFGRVMNQNNQKWDITPDEDATPFRIRLSKNRGWKSAGGSRFSIDDKPIKFYDYNF